MQLQAKNSCLEQEISRLEEDHSIKITGIETTCQWLCDWASKNSFGWNEIKNAVLTLSKKIEERISFEEIDNEIKLDEKFLKEKILPKLSRKNESPAQSMYL